MQIQINKNFIKKSLNFNCKKINSTFRKAAVMCLIVLHGLRYSVILTKRSENLSNHPGQISFPGGLIEKQDLNPLEAAFRETNEEIGILKNEIEILGSLDEMLTGTNFHVTPFVGMIKNKYELKLNSEEVSEIILMPLEVLLNKTNHSIFQKKFAKKTYNFRKIKYLNYDIWGATASILYDFSKKIWLNDFKGSSLKK